ncbi:unnamed protein product [Linum tenue]|uniref:Uncharacterized protein n=1 Tax=Linum tenue TaxID=586396 RepID=A0AAV0N2I8_9ROSI|nr:unnamed protein product [Linum tenue]
MCDLLGGVRGGGDGEDDTGLPARVPRAVRRHVAE